MRVFVDTSVLFKLYHRESQSDFYQSLLLQEADTVVMISQLSMVEFASVCTRRMRMKQLSREQVSIILSFLDKDVQRFGIVELTSGILSRAKLLVLEFADRGLRAPDAIQLATAQALRTEAQLFLTADAMLNDMFSELGLPTP